MKQRYSQQYVARVGEVRVSLVQAGEDFYRCPLTAVQVPTEQLDILLAPVWARLERSRRAC